MLPIVICSNWYIDSWHRILFCLEHCQFCQYRSYRLIPICQPCWPRNTIDDDSRVHVQPLSVESLHLMQYQITTTWRPVVEWCSPLKQQFPLRQWDFCGSNSKQWEFTIYLSCQWPESSAQQHWPYNDKNIHIAIKVFVNIGQWCSWSAYAYSYKEQLASVQGM